MQPSPIAAIASLPVIYRSVFILRAVEEVSVEETAFCLGVSADIKTKAMIQLACVSLLRCKHCVDGTVAKLKAEHKVSDREIAEIMMVASYAAAGTNMAWAVEVFDGHIGAH